MQVYKLAFHGTKYSITINVEDGVLTIEVEQEEAPHARWCGEFTSAYIEDITSKVGRDRGKKKRPSAGVAQWRGSSVASASASF